MTTSSLAARESASHNGPLPDPRSTFKIQSPLFRSAGSETFVTPKIEEKCRSPSVLGLAGASDEAFAYAETRIVLARVLFDFDLELTEVSKSWLENLKRTSLCGRRTR